MSFATQIIKPSNLLTTAAINLFQVEVKTAIDSDAAFILIDLGNVSSMSSSSFIAVVKILQLVRASDRQLFLCSMSQQIRMLFELTGLDQVFKTFVDFDEFNRHMHGTVVGMPRQVKSNIEIVPRDGLKLAS
ncbi:MAG: STAS domain-containing protein [Tildeniella nuda ZEHNDER 1965/U140]|jgi:anti-anti-sigma factor|nr:STAS domain-containing protein [Tildeniella nuda ZEHNDER 1965/U140]